MKKMQGRKQFLLWLMVCLFAVIPSVNVLATSIQGAKNEKSRLEQKRAEIEKTMEELESKKEDILEYIEALDRKQEQLEEEMAQLDAEIASAENHLAQTKVELENAKETVADQYDIMKRRIKYMYENGTSDYLEVFLNAESMADLLNHAEYMSKIAEYDNELLIRYEDSQTKVEETEKEIEAQLKNLAELSEELKLEQETNRQLAADKVKQIEEYNRLIAEAGDKVDEYTAAIQEKEAEIDALIEAERKRKEAEAARLAAEERERQNQAIIAAGQKLLNGGFTWPLPSSTRITSSFGKREYVTAGASTYHQGVDIGASSGSNILAAASGTVLKASYQGAAGKYVLIDHGGDIYTVYMHCSKLLVSEGEHVEQGDVIALVGSTGVSTGPHLHFGLKLGSEYVNPLTYVSY